MSQFKFTRMAAAIPALAAATVLLGGCASQERKYDYSDSPGDRLAEEFELGADRPPTARTLYALARVLNYEERDDECRYILNRAIREDPKFTPAYSELAEIHLRNDRIDEALKVLEIGLRIAPQEPILLNNYGMCWMLSEEYGKALETFTRASELYPNDEKFKGNRAAALGMLGRYDEALDAYLELMPSYDAHYNLGVVCEARNDMVRAAAEFEQAGALRDAQ